MMSCGWLWMYAGAILMLLEILAPGFVIFFFGLAAATVGLAKFALGDAFTLTWQIAAFSALSVIYIALLRRWLKGIFMGDKVVTSAQIESEYVGRGGKVTSEIAPPLEGRVIIGDAEWTAVADTRIAVGATVKVISQQNLTMKVEEVK